MQSLVPLVLDTANLPRKIAERLREHIAQGHCIAGERLPSERELAQALNVSRGALREAVRILEAAGILTVHHGRGTFVAKVDVGARLEALAALTGPSIEPKEIRDLHQIRAVIEPQAAAWAADSIDLDQVRTLFRLCDEADAILCAAPTPDLDRLQRLDGVFHATLFSGSRNAVLERMMGGLMDLLAESRRRSIRRPGRAPASWREHRAVAEAVAAGETEAAKRAMLSHIDNVARSATSGRDSKRHTA